MEITIEIENPIEEVKISKGKTVKIKGNNVYSGLHYAIRSKVTKTIKNYLYEHIRHIQFISQPIRLEIHVYKHEGKWDLGNYCYLWAKCFEDALTGNVLFNEHTRKFNHVIYPPKIKDDNVRHIKQHYYQYHEINKQETPKIIFKLIGL